MSLTRTRYLFRGTIGQTVLLVSVALLIAQGIGFFLIVSERDRWRLLDAIQPAVEQFVRTAQEIDRTPKIQRMSLLFRMNRPDQHFIVTPGSAIAMFRMSREADLEKRLASALANSGLRVKAVAASSVGFASSPPNTERRLFFFPPGMPGSHGARSAFTGMAGPFPGMAPPVAGAADLKTRGPRPVMLQPPTDTPSINAIAEPPPGMPLPPIDGVAINGTPFPGMQRPPFDAGRPRSFGLMQDVNRQEIDLSARLSDGTWLNGQFLSIRPSSNYMWRLALAEAILFAIVLAVTLIVAIRLARPMIQLANASEHMAPDQSPTPVPERGPPDIRAAIRSFNAMTKRVTDLLREKDQMLGALGHDLRTPLASLRIRAETIEPANERQKIIETLEDMTQMVDEILDLARLGHSGEQFVLVDLSSLADAVVEEFREIGKDVTFQDSPRIVVRTQAALVRRLLRNLIENGIKFGTKVIVRVERKDADIELSVSDNGPGIPPDEIERMFEPFTRLEASRSRDTGGIGLGLSIARAIARGQRADLSLENATEGGLIARVTWRDSTK